MAAAAILRAGRAGRAALRPATAGLAPHAQQRAPRVASCATTGRTARRSEATPAPRCAPHRAAAMQTAQAQPRSAPQAIPSGPRTSARPSARCVAALSPPFASRLPRVEQEATPRAMRARSPSWTARGSTAAPAARPAVPAERARRTPRQAGTASARPWVRPAGEPPPVPHPVTRGGSADPLPDPAG